MAKSSTWASVLALSARQSSVLMLSPLSMVHCILGTLKFAKLRTDAGPESAFAQNAEGRHLNRHRSGDRRAIHWSNFSIFLVATHAHFVLQCYGWPVSISNLFQCLSRKKFKSMSNSSSANKEICARKSAQLAIGTALCILC